MNRLDVENTELRRSPALAFGWPQNVVRKLNRAIRQKRPRNIALKSDELSILLDHCDPGEIGSGWLNHHGIQVVVHVDPPVMFRLC